MEHIFHMHIFIVSKLEIDIERIIFNYTHSFVIFLIREERVYHNSVTIQKSVNIHKIIDT